MEQLGPLLMQLGFGGVLGFIIGYALKKILKILLVLLGLYFVSLQYLAHRGFITINYDKLSESFKGLLSLGQSGFTLPSFLTANVPLMGSFVAGLGLGFKMG